MTRNTGISGTWRPLDAAMHTLMVLTLAFMPAAFGAVEPWSQMIVLALLGIMLALLTARTFWRGGWRWSWTYLPVAVFIALIIAQFTLPAPQPRAIEGVTPCTIAVYPLATRLDLCLVLIPAAVFLIAVNLYREPKQIRAILAAVAVIALAVVLVALGQKLTAADHIFWFIPLPEMADTGTFMNHSHYSQFMNLSCGAALGLLLDRLHAAVRGENRRRNVRIVLCLAAVLVLGLGSILLSLSRGGVAGMGAAALFTLAMLGLKQRIGRLGWAIVAVVLAALTFVGYIEFDAVYERLATLSHSREFALRLQMNADALRLWRDYPAFGVGLGNYRWMYGGYDRSGVSQVASHLENEYLQVLAETGVAGAACVAAFVLMIAAAYMRILRRPVWPTGAAAFGLGFGLVAVAVQSLSDFGQHLPANAALSALLCALLVNLARHSRDSQVVEVIDVPSAPSWRPPLRVRAGAIILGALSLGTVGWSLAELDNSRRGEKHWHNALALEMPLREANWKGPDDAFERLLGQTTAAVSAQPNNIEYRYWLNTYRWRSIRRKPAGEHTRQVVREIVDDLHAARPLCPSFGPPLYFAGQLEWRVLDLPQGPVHIEQGWRLARTDPLANYLLGEVRARAGDWIAAVPRLRDAVELDGALWRDVWALLYERLRRPDMALEVARGKIGPLLQLITALANRPEHESIRREARAEAVAILENVCAKPDASAWALVSLARLYTADNLHAEAAMLYQRALAVDYTQVGWRVELARSLAKIGQRDAALAEARIALRLKPDSVPARKLIEELALPELRP